ncbi:hypothetical protein NEFER03_0049 [Nematocida sp. LUAm3]|nr:hypothetical protein NEFER03_0049 [Nematocida sp. LUAm3]KAI5176265.1 hypothetical protein NEFER02_2062 [Nematocida sp. LUAm2]KAI5176723.1 hypothetical protein NEFER01_0048 [Nematocida sp. LUAm1]
MFIESMNQPITNWLNLNYIASKEGSIPRCTIYEHYCEDFRKEGIEPLNTAMFGKVIKMAFPFIRSRRLGNRGNSKYHYFGVCAREFSSEVDDNHYTRKKFLQEYEEIHRKVLISFLEGSYTLAYQELKAFWSANAVHFFGCKSMDKLCGAIEKEFFTELATRTLFLSNTTGYSFTEKMERVSSLKTSAKTLIILCKQVVGGKASASALLRMEAYKEQILLLNSLGNLYRACSSLEGKLLERGAVEEFLGFLESSTCLVQESISLEKSHGLHCAAGALISFYLASESFMEFLLGLDPMAVAILNKKEGVKYEEMQMFFLGLVQELSSAPFPFIEHAVLLCSFFSEYFFVFSNGVSISKLWISKSKEVVKEEVPYVDIPDTQKKQKSFVSQIITSSN